MNETFCNDHFMNEMNFDWDNLRLFLEIARRGGLAAAANSTGKSPPTLARRMVDLERRLKRDLFRRLPRGYELTNDGADLMRQAEAVEALVMPLLQDAAAAKPLVKISAGTWVTHYLCGQASKIVTEDEFILRFISADERLDIGRREAVIGVRNERPTDANLAARKVGPVRFAVYGIPGGNLPWARVLGTTPSARWVQAQADPQNSIEVTGPRTALDLASSGHARAVLPTFVGDRVQGLSRLSPTIEDLDHDQWLVTHHEDRYLPAVRVAIDWVYTLLRDASQRHSR